MTYRLRIHRAAEEELGAAHEWYKRIHPDLGSRFVAEVERVMMRISENPSLYQAVSGFRRARVLASPYNIYFRVKGSDAIVLAVLHGRQDQDRWRTRR